MLQNTKALVQYKGRDISEKLFRSDKTFIGSKSERVQSSQSMSSKIFIEFIALIVRNRIYNLLKEQMIRLETKQKYMTVPAAIRELEKIEMVRRNNGVYKLDHAVTRTQKIILSSFGLDETNICKSAGGYASITQNRQKTCEEIIRGFFHKDTLKVGGVKRLIITIPYKFYNDRDISIEKLVKLTKSLVVVNDLE